MATSKSQIKPKCKEKNRTRAGMCQSDALAGTDRCWSHTRWPDKHVRHRPRLLRSYVEIETAIWVREEAREAGISVSEFVNILLEREWKRSR